MKKASLLLLSVFASIAAVAPAQMFGEAKVGPAVKAYHAYRFETTAPPFGLTKVRAILKAIKPKKDEEGNILATTEWDRMSTEEKFTYCMLHGEDPSQNCDAMPWVVDEQKKIFAYPAGFFGDEVWSDRQSAFLNKRRSDVVRLLRATIRQRRRVGSNLKDTITFLHTNELIPDLIWAYQRDHKDNDILTLLMILMKDGEYKPFLESTTYKKLYGKDASYQSFIVANEANQKLMFQRAMAFYRTRAR